MATVLTLIRIATMIPDALNEIVGGMKTSVAVVAVGLLMLWGFLTFNSVSSDHILPGVPKLKGVPFLGVMPTYFMHGMPQLLGSLIAIGDDGISYAKVVNKVLVSLHDPAMLREVLAYPEEIASR